MTHGKEQRAPSYTCVGMEDVLDYNQLLLRTEFLVSEKGAWTHFDTDARALVRLINEGFSLGTKQHQKTLTPKEYDNLMRGHFSVNADFANGVQPTFAKLFGAEAERTSPLEFKKPATDKAREIRVIFSGPSELGKYPQDIDLAVRVGAVDRSDLGCVTRTETRLQGLKRGALEIQHWKDANRDTLPVEYQQQVDAVLADYRKSLRGIEEYLSYAERYANRCEDVGHANEPEAPAKPLVLRDLPTNEVLDFRLDLAPDAASNRATIDQGIDVRVLR